MPDVRVHHLNCATMRPRLAPPVVAHVLLVERPEGLLLVDSGFGTADIADAEGRLGRPFVAVMRPELAASETAIAQVRALGLDPADVTDIALTHLDLDHAGGIADFPAARVHVHATEHDAAMRPSMREKARYVGAQWAHGPTWVRHEEGGDEWFGFRSARALGDDVVIIPLHGHTRGHAGVGVRRDDGTWLLHAGDAFFDGHQVETPPSCDRTLAIFQRAMAIDNKARKDNTERLRELVARHSDEVDVICAHDRATYERFAG